MVIECNQNVVLHKGGRKVKLASATLPISDISQRFTDHVLIKGVMRRLSGFFFPRAVL
jgi:hypothetical protein